MSWEAGLCGQWGTATAAYFLLVASIFARNASALASCKIGCFSPYKYKEGNTSRIVTRELEMVE